MEPLTILILILVILLVGIVLVFALIAYIRYRFFRFGKAFAAKIIGHVIHNIRGMPAAQKVLEYDKVLDTLLGELGYKGSLGDKMKQYGKNFQDENAIWDAHKERNKIAHEIGYQTDERGTEKLAHVYEREIEGILKRRLQK